MKTINGSKLIEELDDWACADSEKHRELKRRVRGKILVDEKELQEEFKKSDVYYHGAFYVGLLRDLLGETK